VNYFQRRPRIMRGPVDSDTVVAGIRDDGDSAWLICNLCLLSGRHKRRPLPIVRPGKFFSITLSRSFRMTILSYPTTSAIKFPVVNYILDLPFSKRMFTFNFRHPRSANELTTGPCSAVPIRAAFGHAMTTGLHCAAAPSLPDNEDNVDE
jgi:hypothetical protein